MSSTARLRTLLSLPAGERSLALRAVAVMLVVRVALWAVQFPRLRELMEWWMRGRTARADAQTARAVRRAVDRAARSMPASACLVHALTAEVMLRRDGYEARVSVGVAPNGAPLAAHAWVESAGIVVAGDDEDLAKYRTLIVFGPDTRPVRPASDA